MVRGTKSSVNNDVSAASDGGGGGAAVVGTGGQEFLTCDIKTPSFLRDCRPEAYFKCYVHVIDIHAEHEMPDVDRKKHFYALMATDICNFGIITRTPMPEICRFPLYSDLGQIRVRIIHNYRSISFTQAQLHTIVEFHKFLFMNIVRKVKKCFVFDAESSSSSFLIVPLKKTDSGDLSIAWSVMRNKTEMQFNRSSEFERYTEDNLEDDYLNKVVTPWYRKEDIPLFYIVTNVNTGVYMNSNMEFRNETFAQYFKKRYKLKATQEKVQLLEVRMITNILESIKPRAITASAKLKKRKKKDFQTFFHPEFVIKQKFPASFWYKSILLPSILHRFHYLLLAEDLRQTIVKETGVGRLYSPVDPREELGYFIETVAEVETRPKNVADAQKSDGYCLILEAFKNVNIEVERFVKPPCLSLLKQHSGGPSQYDVLEALTLRGANDTICLERLETLGDSYLKFIVSLSIFIRHSKMSEGEMTQLRSERIGNNNLTNCGEKREIPGCIQGTTFCVDSSWTAPSFCVPPEIRDYLLKSGCLPALLQVCIPDAEQLSGNVSRDTINLVRKLTSRCGKSYNKLEKAAVLYYLGKHEVSHKSVADVVEALIGVYLKTCGIHCAYKVVKFFGIIADEDYADYCELTSQKVTSAVSSKKIKSVRKMFPNYSRVEQVLQYEFGDKGLLLQAFTHSSCLTNKLTESYQRLEFIGDAVIDFLITSYIYEYCGDMPPGQITDLRSALVNNNTFGALIVRLGFHEYLVDPAESVKNEVRSFADHQKEKNYAINEFLIVLPVKNNMPMAEEVKVPKVLADVFESLAGAIFIDSGFDLEVVWRIFYNIMMDEIAKFSVKVPINPVRALYELNSNVEFESIGKAGGDEVIGVVVNTNNGKKKFYGKGTNSWCAKRAAAKLALRNLGYTQCVI